MRCKARRRHVASTRDEAQRRRSRFWAGCQEGRLPMPYCAHIQRTTLSDDGSGTIFGHPGDPCARSCNGTPEPGVPSVRTHTEHVAARMRMPRAARSGGVCAEPVTHGFGPGVASTGAATPQPTPRKPSFPPALSSPHSSRTNHSPLLAARQPMRCING